MEAERHDKLLVHLRKSIGQLLEPAVCSQANNSALLGSLRECLLEVNRNTIVVDGGRGGTNSTITFTVMSANGSICKGFATCC